MIVVIITAIVLALYIYVVVRDTFGDRINKGFCLPFTQKAEDKWKYIKWWVFHRGFNITPQDSHG